MIVQGKGVLVFDPVNLTKKHNKQASWKRTAYIRLDDDTDSYYRWFLNRRFSLHLQKPIRGSHITIINDMVNRDFTQEKWEQVKSMFNGKEISFEYNVSDIRSNGEHWYIKVGCQDGLNIRNIIGLGDPYYGFHITLGRVGTELEYRLGHSEYILRQILRFGL